MVVIRPDAYHFPAVGGSFRTLPDGAALVECSEDVLRELGWAVPPAAEAGVGEGPAWLACLRADEAMSLDTLAGHSCQMV